MGKTHEGRVGGSYTACEMNNLRVQEAYARVVDAWAEDESIMCEGDVNKGGVSAGSMHKVQAAQARAA